MTKLYYNNAIDALYMSEKFGVKFDTRTYLGNYASLSFIELKAFIEVNYLWEVNDLFYWIAPESMKIFEPIEGDMILYREKYGACVECESAYSFPADNPNHCDPMRETLDGSPLKDKIIIFRNNMPFITPKSEVSDELAENKRDS